MNNPVTADVGAHEDYRPWQPVEDWMLLQGRDVEIYDSTGLMDHGRVEAVTADGKILWLMHDGAYTRRIVQRTSGTNVRLR